MSATTGIEWTTATWNPIVGCARVSEGCRNCYAEKMAARLAAMADADVEAGRDPGRKAPYAQVAKRAPSGTDGQWSKPLPQWNGRVEFVGAALAEPLRWTKPRAIFVCSMSDLFHPSVSDDWLDQIFAMMALCPQHRFQLLTKRPERMADYLLRRVDNDDGWAPGSAAIQGVERVLDDWSHGGNAALNAMLLWDEMGLAPLSQLYDRGGLRLPSPNVWLGTSVENQASLEERLPHLLRCPAAVRFVSAEPLLEPIDFAGLGAEAGLHWVIAGGESGPRKDVRPCELEWMRSIVRQCSAGGVACFVKQLGSAPLERAGGIPRTLRLRDRTGGDPAEWPPDLAVREFPSASSIETRADSNSKRIDRSRRARCEANPTDRGRGAAP